MITANINGSASTTYGIVFTASAVNALLTPPPVKASITNKSRAEHGKRVINSAPKYDDRDVTLELYLYASGWTEFDTRRAAMIKLFTEGRTSDSATATYQIDVTLSNDSNTHYRLRYLSCTQFTQFNGRLAKFQVKFNEPNPNNRSTIV